MADFCTFTPLTSVELYGYSTCSELPLNVKQLMNTKVDIFTDDPPTHLQASELGGPAEAHDESYPHALVFSSSAFCSAVLQQTLSL